MYTATGISSTRSSPAPTRHSTKPNRTAETGWRSPTWGSAPASGSAVGELDAAGAGAGYQVRLDRTGMQSVDQPADELVVEAAHQSGLPSGEGVEWAVAQDYPAGVGVRFEA